VLGGGRSAISTLSGIIRVAWRACARARLRTFFSHITARASFFVAALLSGIAARAGRRVSAHRFIARIARLRAHAGGQDGWWRVSSSLDVDVCGRGDKCRGGVSGGSFAAVAPTCDLPQHLLCNVLAISCCFDFRLLYSMANASGIINEKNGATSSAPLRSIAALTAAAARRQRIENKRTNHRAGGDSRRASSISTRTAIEQAKTLAYRTCCGGAPRIAGMARQAAGGDVRRVRTSIGGGAGSSLRISAPQTPQNIARCASHPLRRLASAPPLFALRADERRRGARGDISVMAGVDGVGDSAVW